MNRTISTSFTILAAAGLSFVVTRWTAARSAAPPSADLTSSASTRATSAPWPPWPRLHSGSRDPKSLPEVRTTNEVAEARIDERSDEQRVRDFRTGLENRLNTSDRDEASAEQLRSSIRNELLSKEHIFPHLREADVSCATGICQVRIQHPDSGSESRFQHSLISGDFLNRPEILNESNGCNLHVFTDVRDPLDN